MTNIPMKLTAFRTNNPDIDLFENTSYTQIEKDRIMKHFQFRRVCSDLTFSALFNDLVQVFDYPFHQRLRIESVSFDPMVATYIERSSYDYAINKTTGTDSSKGVDTTTNSSKNETNNTGKKTNTETLNTTDSGSGTATRTDNLTATNNSHGTSKADTSATSGTTGENRSISSENPDSASYSSATPGKLPSMDWKYVQAQNGTDNKSDSVSEGHDTGESDSTTTQTNTGTQSNENTSTLKKTGTVTNVGEDNDSSTSNRSDTGSATREHTRQHSLTGDSRKETNDLTTGRSEAPQDLLPRALDFYNQCESLNWLYKKLETCFYQLYEEGDF